MAVLLSCRLAYVTSAPPERKIIILNFYASYCSLLSLSLSSKASDLFSNCQRQTPARSTSKIILGWLTCKAVQGNPKKELAARFATTPTTLPVLLRKYLVTPLQKHGRTTPPSPTSVHRGSSRSISLHVRTV